MRLDELLDLIGDYCEMPADQERRMGRHVDRDAAWQAIVEELERVYRKAGELQ